MKHKIILLVTLIGTIASANNHFHQNSRHQNSTPLYSNKPYIPPVNTQAIPVQSQNNRQVTPSAVIPKNITDYSNSNRNKPPFFNRSNNYSRDNYNRPDRNYNNRNRRSYNNNRPYRYDNRGYRSRSKPRRQQKNGFFKNFTNPQKFMRDPQDTMSDMWDDGFKEPTTWGKMPGGWNVPSVSVPNPIDSADDFGRGVRDIPEGFNYGR